MPTHENKPENYVVSTDADADGYLIIFYHIISILCLISWKRNNLTGKQGGKSIKNCLKENSKLK